MQIKKIFIIFLFLISAIQQMNAYFGTTPTFSIMLDPAGDAMHTGRRLPDSFEHGITMQYAKELKEHLEQTYSGIRVIITRFADEILQPLQSANFANRLDVDLFLSLHFYQEKETKPHLGIYLYSYGQEFLMAPNELSFCSYDQAYLCPRTKTTEWANKLYEALGNDQYKRLFETQKPYKLPFKQLVGIKSPAIGLEMSIKNRYDWQTFVEPITTALKPIIEQGGGITL